MPEIVDVLQRCKTCGGALAVSLLGLVTDPDGTPIRAYWREDVPHTRSDCNALVALTREQWPTLW